MNYLRLLIHGVPGIGKTVLLGTALDIPGVKNVLLLDIEGNTDSIESKCEYITADSILKPVPGKINVLRITNFKQYFAVVNMLSDKSQDDNFPYKGGAVLTDSLSELDELSLLNAISVSGIAPSKRNFEGVAMQPEYGISRIAMKNVIRNMGTWPCHLFYTSFSYKDEGEDSPTLNHLMPQLYGKLKNDIPGALKQTGHLSLLNDRRVLRCYPKGKTFGKDCSEGGKLSVDIVDPTLKKVYDLRYGN